MSTAPLPETISVKPGTRYRVTYAAGAQVELVNVAVRGDSLIGTVAHKPISGMERFAIPAAEVERVEVRRVDTGVTALLVVGIVVLVGGAVAFIVGMSQMDLSFGGSALSYAPRARP